MNTNNTIKAILLALPAMLVAGSAQASQSAELPEQCEAQIELCEQAADNCEGNDMECFHQEIECLSQVQDECFVQVDEEQEVDESVSDDDFGLDPESEEALSACESSYEACVGAGTDEATCDAQFDECLDKAFGELDDEEIEIDEDENLDLE